jgi:hypothetical protein
MYLTPKQAAAELQVNPRTLLRWARESLVPSIHIGHTVRFASDAIGALQRLPATNQATAGLLGGLLAPAEPIRAAGLVRDVDGLRPAIRRRRGPSIHEPSFRFLRDSLKPKEGK